MSRYIRTEDKILDTELNDYDAEIISKHIVKEADTIEELLDAVASVYSVNGETKRLLHQETSCDNLKNLVVRHFKYISGYGLIWTDIGLIYVAEINEKGEFELI